MKHSFPQKHISEITLQQQQIAAAQILKNKHMHELKEPRNNLDEKNARIEELKKNKPKIAKYKQLLVDLINEWKKKLEQNQAKQQKYHNHIQSYATRM